MMMMKIVFALLYHVNIVSLFKLLKCRVFQFMWICVHVCQYA